jgi:hypothetical protein
LDNLYAEASLLSTMRWCRTTAHNGFAFWDSWIQAEKFSEWENQHLNK